MNDSTVLPADATSALPGTDLEHEVAGLRDLGLYDLRELWLRRIGRVPKYLSAELLRRRLAYELQKRVHGSLTPQICRRLGQLHEAFKADPNYVPTVGQAVTVGTVLARTWRGTVHKVTVLSGGFEYRGQTYESLSGVAKLITGAKWSGPAFFGFRRGQR